MKKNKNKKINVVFYSEWDPYIKWKKVLSVYNIMLHKWPDDFIKTKIYPKIEGALVWDPPSEMWAYFPKIKIIQSLGAGVDHIIKNNYPKDVNIIKLNDPNLGNQISEYVLMSVLMCYRKFFQYLIYKSNKQWKQLKPMKKSGFKITILGYGNIAKLVVKKLQLNNFQVNVWGHSERKIKKINYFYGKEQLRQSLKNASCLICLLPLTPQTNNIIGLKEFKILNSESYFINVGRGNTVNENELIYSLENSILTGAVLDVFKQEPLKSNNKLWLLNNVFISPHIAGITNPTNYAAKLLKENFIALYNNKKLRNLVNPIKGY